MQLTMQDLRVRDYKLPELEGDIATKSRNALLYIEQLASMTKRDVSKWDMIALFKRPNGDGLVYDRNKINEIFFSQPNLDDVKVDNVPESLRNDILEGKIRIESSALSELKRKESRLVAEINSLNRTIEDKLVYLRETRDKVINASNPHEFREQIVKGLNDVLSMGFFKLKDKHGDGKYNADLYFETVPVVLTYKKPAHGIDMQVPLGKFEVYFNLSNFRMYVNASNSYNSQNTTQWHKFRPHQDNIYDDGYIHPHINDGGSICWGTINAAEIILRRDLGALFMALQHVLTQYNHDSAYRVIQDFDDKYKKILKFQTEGGPSGSEEQEVEEDDSDHPFCGLCGEHEDDCSCEE